MHHPTVRIVHTTAFVTPVVAQWVHPVKDRSYDPSYHERTLLCGVPKNKLRIQLHPIRPILFLQTHFCIFKLDNNYMKLKHPLIGLVIRKCVFF